MKHTACRDGLPSEVPDPALRKPGTLMGCLVPGRGWDQRLFPAGGAEETVVVLRPGRPSKAALSDAQTPGHGRNWAVPRRVVAGQHGEVEGKPGAGFHIKYDAEEQSVSCEHA